MELTIPNGQLAGASTFNCARPTPVMRRSAHVVVDHEVPPGRVQQLILGGILGVPGVRESPAPSVVTEDFEEHGARYWARFFIDEYTRRFVVDGAVRDRIRYALSRDGISPAVPVRNVQVHETVDEIDQRRRADAPARALVALTQVELLRLDKAALQSVLADNPQLMELLDQRLAARREELSSLAPKTEAGKQAASDRETEALLERIRGFLGIR